MGKGKGGNHETVTVIYTKYSTGIMLNMELVRSPKDIWAPCAQVYSLAETPPPEI
jgi:hypothetical protein